MKRQKQTISNIFNATSIAVVGASEDQTKFGGRLLRMLLKHGYAGKVFPVNPTRESLFGLTTYPSLEAIPEGIELVVFTVPRHIVKEQFAAAGEKGARGAIIISSGFSDTDEQGAHLEQELVQQAHDYGMRIIGPNCLGVISSKDGLVLCSSPILEIEAIPQSPIGFISQSGALMTTYFDRMWSKKVGFSYGVSVGNQGDLELSDFVEFLVEDQSTSIICTYIEGIKDAKKFLQVAQQVRHSAKPWLAVKAGRSSAGSEAAFSHTASVAGDHAVFTAICRDQGITLMDDMGAMFVLAQLMASTTVREIEKIAIVTPSGGAGALAVDALAELGVEIATFSDATKQKLNAHFPIGQANNPIDIGARKTADHVITAQAIIDALHDDEQSDVILIVVAMSPQAWMVELAVALQVRKAAGMVNKPILFAIDAGVAADDLRAYLAEQQIPYCDSTLEAVQALAAWRSRSQYKPLSPSTRPEECGPYYSENKAMVLNEEQAKYVLEQYGVPTNLGLVATNELEAVSHAQITGYPLVMKIISPQIIHKTEVGGVILPINNEAEAKEAYLTLMERVQKNAPHAQIIGVSIQKLVRGELELIIGAKWDEQFGPIMVFGGGGILVELMPERVIAQAPMAKDDIRRLLGTLAIGKVLTGYRGKPLDFDGVVEAIERISWLAYDLARPGMELDINPFVVGQLESCAVDARLRLSE